MPINEVIQVYRNEKLKAFVESFSEEDQKIVHKTLQFFRTEFPECEKALRGKLIYEEKS